MNRGGSRGKFSREFKLEAAALSRQPGMTVKRAAADRDAPVDPGRLGPASTGMSFSGPRTFAAFGGFWLGVGRHHGRRCGRHGLLLPTTLLQFGNACLLLGNAFAGGQQCQGDHFRSISVELAGKHLV